MRRIPARPTTYNGIQMRSRLEAEFAAWLDQNDLEWQYEPRAYADQTGQYLPDFAITFDEATRWFIEVKPTEQMAWIATERVEIVWSSEPKAILSTAWRDRDEWRFIWGTKDDGWKSKCESCVDLTTDVKLLEDQLANALDSIAKLSAERDSLDHRLAAIENRVSYDGNGRLESVAEIVHRLAVQA